MGRVDVYDFDEISAESSTKVNLSSFYLFFWKSEVDA